MSQKKKTDNEEEALESALSPIVNRLIDKNFEKSGDKIASQMAPLIGGAIREQIKSQKDDIVDALYPVMGNMISKFVTKSLEELLNKINQQIQNGLSIEAVKRKFKAKIKGVSETELLLQENAAANIKAALLIHKESGTLLAKVENEQSTLSDADMLASMMTAIRSFVNDWLAADKEHQELGEIEFGGNKIIIEASGSSYLAVIVEGAAYAKTYDKIRHALEQIVLKYGENIKEFNGDFSQFPQNELQEQLKTLLLENIEEKEEEKKSTHPLLYLLPLLLILFFAYKSYEEYVDEELQEQIVSQIHEVPALSPFAIKVTVEDKNATLFGKVPFAYHKQLAKESVANIKGLSALNNEIEVVPTLTDPMQLSAQIAYLIKGVNLATKSNVSYNFDYQNLRLFGTMDSLEKKEKLLQELHTMQGIKSIKDDIVIASPKIETDIYFKKASSQLSKTAKEKLLKITNTLNTHDYPVKLQLNAYSDMLGSKKKNAALAQKRLDTIASFLKQNTKHTPSLKLQVLHQAPDGIDPLKNPDMARCVSINTLKEQ
jgi:outer membrane protein OmpA-like peptidoglycan-associated protein